MHNGANGEAEGLPTHNAKLEPAVEKYLGDS